MEQIKELSKFVTETRLKKVELIDFDRSKSGDTYLEVTEKVADDEITTEEQIAEFIGTEPGSPKFRMFKTRLKDKLANNVLLLNVNETDKSPYHKAIALCARNAYCIKILFIFNAVQTANNMAKSTLGKAIEFEQYDVAYYCACILRRTSSYSGNEEEFQKYNLMVLRYGDLLFSEGRASCCIERLTIPIVNTNIFKKEYQEIAIQSLGEVSQIFKEHPTYFNGLTYYRVKSVYECLVSDYTAALQTWETFEQYIEKYKDFEYALRMGESSMQKLYCNLCLGDYEAGQRNVQQCEKYYKPSHRNWFTYMEHFFLLAMRTRNYEQATAIYQDALSKRQFRFLNINRQQKWKIYEAYNFIVRHAKYPNPERYFRDGNKFKLHKFLNETPIYNKDKEGFNTSILIAQIMILMLERKFEELAEKTDALKKYASRYFGKKAQYKGHVFMQMIILADKHSYNLEKTQKVTAELYKELEKTEHKPFNSYEGLEIVPYVDLWAMVMEYLKEEVPTD